MATIHISEAEAARDLPALLAQVRAGSEVIIESDARPIAVISPPTPRGRLLSESLALAKQYAEENGGSPTPDDDFASDMREIIANRKPADRSAWD